MYKFILHLCSVLEHNAQQWTRCPTMLFQAHSFAFATL